MYSNFFGDLKQHSFLWFALIGFICSCNSPQNGSVRQVMDQKITELYKTKSLEELKLLDNRNILNLFSKKELDILATRHWYFHSNVPVIVSVMRDMGQKNAPFWLEQRGFVKTDLSMKNENTTYEVWQKKFDAGTIGLGVNGFDESLALHYFVSVTPENTNDSLLLSGFYPENQKVIALENGSPVYLDWDELVLFDVPEQMKGQKLLTTFRGRASESHLVGAFRTTAHPSSATPDNFILTWSADPENSVDIQWRTNTSVASDTLQYRQKGEKPVLETVALKDTVEDRMLFNDRYIHRFTAKPGNLKPGVVYEYKTSSQKEWTEKQMFKTASDDSSFSFLWFGDTHYSSHFADIFNVALKSHPETAFFTIAGDLVSDGLFRDQWDELFSHISGFSGKVPLMAVPGNHDNRAGLGAELYQKLFSFPRNGPDGVPSEQTYSFTYKNSFFLMIDATSPFELQTNWIEKQLSECKTRWKFAIFHFPPYNCCDPYPVIQKLWLPIFDKYHVDMVFSGHVHYYMRSKPIYNGQVVRHPKDGTVYVISVAIPSHDTQLPAENYAASVNYAGHLYQYLQIKGGKLIFETFNIENKRVDSFEIIK